MLDRVAAVSLGNAAIVALAFVMACYELWLYSRGRRREHALVAVASLLAAVYAGAMLVHYNAPASAALTITRVETVCIILVVHCAPLAAQEIVGRRTLPLWVMVVSALVMLALVPTPFLVGTEVEMRHLVLLDHPFPRRVETPYAIVAEIYAFVLVAYSLVILRRHGKRMDVRHWIVATGGWAVFALSDAVIGLIGAPLLLNTFEYGFCFFAAALVARDVRRYMYALDATARDFHRLIEHSPDAIAVLHDGKIVYVNEAMSAALGPGNVAIDRPIQDMVHDDDHDAVVALLASPGASDVVTLRFISNEDTVHLEAVTIGTEFRGREAIVLMARDVTARQELTARMIAMDRMITIGTMAAGVGHEINNPLSYVILNLQEAREILDEEQRKVTACIDAALDGASRIADTARGLSLFSRREPTLRSLDLTAVLESAIAMATNEVTHRAQLVVDVEPELFVRANETKLGQVFVNLLVNAAHAIPAGDAYDNEVRVKAFERDGEVVVEVSDTGEGITKAAMPRIFDAFFTTKPPSLGTGLGLGICKATVESLGGHIEVRSTEGHGATFSVVLPLGEKTESVQLASPLVSGERWRPHVLLVDDEVHILRALSRVLRADANVETALSAREALPLVRNGEFDLVISDLMMPNGSGIDLHAGLSESNPDLASSMIFITGGVFTNEVVEFQKSVDNEFLDKPIDVELLQDRIRHLEPRSAPNGRVMNTAQV